MRKIPILLTLATALIFQTVPAYCNSITLEVSATLPEHAMSANLGGMPSSNAIQMAQTETVTRNHQNVALTSIVVP